MLIDDEIGIFLKNLLLKFFLNVLLNWSVINFLDNGFRLPINNLDLSYHFLFLPLIYKHIRTFTIVTSWFTLEGCQFVVLHSWFVAPKWFTLDVFKIKEGNRFVIEFFPITLFNILPFFLFLFRIFLKKTPLSVN